MTRSEWYEFILGQANDFLNANEEDVYRVRREDGTLDALAIGILDQLEPFLVGGGAVYDVIRYSELETKRDTLWRGETEWDSVVFKVACACLEHDIKKHVALLLDGKAPRRIPPKDALN